MDNLSLFQKMEINICVLYYQFNYRVEVSPATVLDFNHLKTRLSGRGHWVGTYKEPGLDNKERPGNIFLLSIQLRAPF
jgi:hypothetical protein